MTMNNLDSIIEKNATQEENVITEEVAQEPIVVETSEEEIVTSTEPNSNEEPLEFDEIELSDSYDSETTESEQNDMDSEPTNAEDADNEVTDTINEEPFVWQKPPYHERYYLKYRDGKRTTELDLTGTRAFLQNLGFDGGVL